MVDVPSAELRILEEYKQAWQCAVQSHEDTLKRSEAESEILRGEVKRRRAAELQVTELKKQIEDTLNGTQEIGRKRDDTLLQVGVLKTALGKCFMACSVCDNGGECDDHPKEMRDLLRTNDTRIPDECGQVKCRTCDVMVYPTWADGTPRPQCSKCSDRTH